MNITLTNATSCATHIWIKTPTVIRMVMFITHCVVGFPLNCYVIRLYLTRGGGLDVAVIFALSQSLAEIIFCAAAPITILCLASDELCFMKPLGFLGGVSMSSWPLFQCCICIERYLAVVHPVTFLRYKPMRYRLTCAVLIWMCTLACGVICVFYFPDLPFWIFGIVYTVTVITDVFCCVSILKALLQPKPGEGQMEDAAMNATKKKAFTLVSVNLLAMLVQIVPSAVILGFQPYFTCPISFDVAASSTFISNVIAGFVQPVFFLHRAGKLRCKRCS